MKVYLHLPTCRPRVPRIRSNLEFYQDSKTKAGGDKGGETVQRSDYNNESWKLFGVEDN